MKLRVVIVTYNWPPRNAIGTHRPYAWARYWAEAGAEVTVLTAEKQPFDEPLDLNLPLLDGVTVVEVPSAGGGKKFSRFLLKFSWLRGVAKIVKRFLGRMSVLAPDPRDGWLGASAAISEALAQYTDVVVSTYGPASAHLIGHRMKRANPSVRWVADYRDLWSLSHLVSMSPKQREALTYQEVSTVGKLADEITVVSEDMALKMEALTGKSCRVMPNGFDIDRRILSDRFRDFADKVNFPVRIVHTGMLYPGARDPEPLLVALRELYDEGKISKGQITLDFYGSRVDVAKELSKRQEYSHFIRLLGHVSREESLTAQREASLLLVLESALPEARGVLTGKVFEYISSGRPIICIGSKKDYELPVLLSRTGTGISFESGEINEIKDKIYNIVLCHRYDFYSPVVLEVEKYSREFQSKLFMDIFREN